MARNLIVINVDFKETRVALIEDGVIAELQIERAAHRSTVGNVVLGRVTRVLPGMQAAFIDVGQERAAFLHVEDLIRPDDFDAYLAGDARDEQKPQTDKRQAAGPEAADVDEGSEETATTGTEAAQPARRGRRRRGRRGRGRPGAETEPLSGPSLLQPGTDQGAGVVPSDDDGDMAAQPEDEDGPVTSRYVGHAGGASQSAGASTRRDKSPGGETGTWPVGSARNEGLSAATADWSNSEARDAAQSYHRGSDSEAESQTSAEFAAEPKGQSRQADDDDLSSDDDVLFSSGESDLDDEELFPHDHGEDDDDEELFVRDDDDSDDDDSDDSDDEDVFGRDEDDEDDELFDDDDDDDELFVSDDSDDDDDELFGDDEDDSDEEQTSLFDLDEPHTADDTSHLESGPESGAFTEVDPVVLTADRESYVNVATASDDEPPSSGERQTALVADVVQPDVPVVARRTRQRARREPLPTAPDERSGVESESAESDTAEGQDVRKRRGRRRRRRNGRGEASPPDTAAVSVQEREVPSNDSAPDSDAGRGRRRRGRRRGRASSKPEATVEAAAVSKNGSRRMPARVSRSVPISEVVKEGNLVVVQISKEPIGTKGARVTSHVSLPGRYVVYLPTVEHVGISKRIGNARERARLRKSIEAIKPAHGGLIVRTVAEGLTKKQLKADIGYLIKVWADVAKRRETAKPAEVLYEELDLVLKAARDLFTDEVQQIVIDDRDQHGRLSRFVEMFMPGRVKDIKLYTGDEPIFDAYGIEDEIKRALSRKVPLPSGGSLVMDQAEALTAIDVNTGRYVGKGSKDLEETAFKTNLEAVDEIAYQLRFRNIGGLVILDLIDMEKAENRERVWRTLEQKLSKDKAKTTINRISELGLIEMTRKRTRESLGRVMHEPCFYCDGTGHIQSRETIAYEILRQIRRDRMSLTGYSVRVLAHPAVVDFLKHEARDALQQAERLYLRRIELMPRQEYHIEQYDLQGR